MSKSDQHIQYTPQQQQTEQAQQQIAVKPTLHQYEQYIAALFSYFKDQK